MGRLRSLSRRIMDDFYNGFGQDPRCLVESVQLPDPIPTNVEHIICDPATWEEMAGVEKVGVFIVGTVSKPRTLHGLCMRLPIRLTRAMYVFVTKIYTHTPIAADWSCLIRADSVPTAFRPPGMRLSHKHRASPPTIARDDVSSNSTSRGKSGDVASIQTLEGSARPKVVHPPRVMMAGACTKTLHRSIHSALKEYFGLLRISREYKPGG